MPVSPCVCFRSLEILNDIDRGWVANDYGRALVAELSAVIIAN